MMLDEWADRSLTKIESRNVDFLEDWVCEEWKPSDLYEMEGATEFFT